MYRQISIRVFGVILVSSCLLNCANHTGREHTLVANSVGNTQNVVLSEQPIDLLQHPKLAGDYQLDTCYPIPNDARYICAYVFRPGAMMEVDVKYFVTSANVAATEVASGEGSGQSFCGLIFSEGGRYLATCFADEGHPMFGFYETNSFIGRKDAQLVGSIFYDHYLEYFQKITDQGDIFYVVSNDNSQHCPTGSKSEQSEFNNQCQRYCLARANIFDQPSDSFGLLSPVNVTLDCTVENL